MKNKNNTMSPEEFEKLIQETEDPWDIQKTFLYWSEDERKKLSKTASELYKKRFSVISYSKAAQNSLLSIVALCPISILKKNNSYIQYQDIMGQIIIDRKPHWLDEWVQHDLQKEIPDIKFPVLRRWIKEGICKKPDIDVYYQMFAQHLSAMEYVPEDKKNICTPITKQLAIEPEMVEDIWKLFEFETIAFNTESWLTNGAPPEYETWPQAIIKLMNEGHLDRDRLLEVSIKGLTFDVKQNQLSGIHKLHIKIKPTIEEIERLQPDYLTLLCHKIGHVVKFALKMLGQLAKKNRLDASAFLSEAPVIFLHENKGNADTTLKIVKKIISNEPKHIEPGLKVIVEALRHANVDVQNSAFEALEDHKASLTKDVKDELLSLSNYVAESLKKKIQALSGHGNNSENAQADNIINRKELEEKLSQLPNKQVKALGLDGVFTRDSFEFSCISSNILDHEILPTLEPITPIQDLDELISAVSHAVEIVDSPDEVERILDGISRLCNNRPDDFKDKIEALSYRLKNSNTEKGICTTFNGGIQRALFDFLITWVTGRFHNSVDDARNYKPTDAFVPTISFIKNTTKRISKNISHPLISSPTHTGGWIDPEVWVQKLIDSEKDGIIFDRLDFCLSLLRLAPDNRKKALKRASKLSSDLSAIVTFALGGDIKPTYQDRENYNLWISAARSRNPYADWYSFFEEFKMEDNFADSLRPAQYQWEAYFESPNGGSCKHPHVKIEIKVEDIKKTMSTETSTDWKKLPSAALSQWIWRVEPWTADHDSTWVTHWLLYQWPLRPDGAYATGVKRFRGLIDWGTRWEAQFTLLNGLFQKNRPWCDIEHLMLCYGLNLQIMDARALATDALIEGIENGLLNIDMMVDTLVQTSNGWQKFNRLGEAFTQVSQVSLLHAWCIRTIIQKWLPQVDIKQRNIFKMLGVLLEIQHVIKQPLSQETVDTLKAFKGSNKAEKLAKQILKLSDLDETVMNAIKCLAVEYRLQGI